MTITDILRHIISDDRRSIIWRAIDESSTSRVKSYERDTYLIYRLIGKESGWTKLTITEITTLL
jgi:hypothetical protein